MAAQDLDSILDDALAAFDDDDDRSAAGAAPPPAARASTPPAPDSGAAAAEVSSSGAAAGEGEAAAGPEQPTDEAGPSDSKAAAGAASGSTGLVPPAAGSKPFDPLGSKRRPKKGPGLPGGAPAGLGGAAPAGLGGASGLGGGGRRALRPDAAGLEDDLMKLVAEWQQALHPESDGPDLPGPGPQSAAASSAQQQQQQQQQQQRPRPGSAVLRALEEQTRRTVAEQAGHLHSGRSSSGDDTAGEGDGDGGGEGGGDHVSRIMDVVMQHLLSKDVLYQPMMEIRDKYPPWLEAHRATAPPADVARYEAQYAAICRLVDAYERTPGDFGRIMTLLQEMQACGEPPPEIVDDMSSAIGAELPPGFGSGGGLGGLGGGDGDEELDLPPELLRALPDTLRGCPMQ